MVLFRQNFRIIYWLFSGVNVVLMDFTIERRDGTIMLLLSHSFLLHRGRYCLVNSSVMVARFGPEFIRDAECVIRQRESTYKTFLTDALAASMLAFCVGKKGF